MLKTLAALVETFRAWQSRQSAYNELMSLDDRSLADIGLSRSQISFVLKHQTDRDETVIGTAGQVYAPANGNLSRAA